ncbi:MAG TPA: tRNA 2-thiocytidine biosynthesis TtcA family protein [Eubacteriales bacterium]|nr:tRNA 2-thiocytidine biosynthesis TtcA family protein [Eubacteriales bacterium]
MKRVLGSIRRADEKYHMIEDGDKVCIGVSGGKDSLLLMEAMKLYQRFAYTKFDVIAVMLDLGLKRQDTSAIEALAERIGMEFTVEKTDIGKVVFEYRQERSPCALCAKLRRGALNTFAVEHGCNKVALGHNREDVIETFFMSMLYEGRINTFAPVTYLSRRDVTVIRPLIFLPEKYAQSVAKARNLPVLPPNCDIAGKTKREEAKQLVSYLCRLTPDFEEKFMHALSTTETYGLWDRMRLKGDESHRR